VDICVIFGCMTKSNFRSTAANSIGLRGNAVLTAAEVRAVESRYSEVDMMRRAGRAAFDFLRERTASNAKITLVVGPGNNGGDALACAAELAGAGYTPAIIMLGDPAKFGEDATRAWQRVLECGSGVIHDRPIEYAFHSEWIVDGLFGIGLKRPLNETYTEIATKIADARAIGSQVLALDVPSGIDADTGAIVGDVAIAADHTLTFIAHKPGLLTGAALDHVGELHLATLGLDVDSTSNLVSFGHDTMSSELRLLERLRFRNDHKGTNGTLAVVGGANGMLGAVLLAARAAMRTGVGKVKVGWLAEPFPPIDPQMPELMMTAANALAESDAAAWVVGCGMGVSGQAARVLKTVLSHDRTCVVDADALNLIAQSADLAALMQKRSAATIITPHPTEAARLLGCATTDVQRDRIRAARDLAKGYRCIAVLKGAGTVISDGEHTSINTTGNTLLATAGTGDVLAGMIGALVARGHAAFSAAQLAVAMHGAAADEMRKRGIQRAVASDVIDELRRL
jgi:ADP-dependent NAD(P)H-hydrate dehydratase / NAD(P)H-hydrate epimerase